MTPFDVANHLADHLKSQLTEHQERLGADDALRSVDNVYAGFLPRARSSAELEKLCPAIVIRPDTVTDGKERSLVSLVIYVTVYDTDLTRGCMSLYHLLEFVRAHLLLTNPVIDKCWVQPGLKTIIPDEQPFPQWIGVVEFEVAIPQVYSPSRLVKEWGE